MVSCNCYQGQGYLQELTILLPILRDRSSSIMEASATMEKNLAGVPSDVSLEPPSETSEPVFKSIGPTSSTVLIGVKYDLKTGQYLSYIKSRTTARNLRVGLFFTEEQAAIAHDMQSLKAYGLLAGEDLNYSYLYEVEQSSDSTSSSSSAVNKTIRLKLKSGVIVSIECDEEEQQNSSSQIEKASDITPLISDTVPETVVEAEAVDSLICSPAGTSAVLPGKTDVNRRWPERLVSSFYPTAAFAYEVTFMQQSSLGLQLRPLLLTYSVAGGKRTLGCCVVIDASQSPSQLVQAGDILVSVNGLSLIGAQPQTGDMREASGGFSFDTSVKAISQAIAPRTIRFLRTAGLSVNQQLSPAEASLLVADNHPIAKYAVEQSTLTGGGPHQTQLYLDNQVINLPIFLHLKIC